MVYSSGVGVSQQLVSVKEFTMLLKGRAIVKEGVNLSELLEHQHYNIDPTKEGSILDLNLETVTETGSSMGVLESPIKHRRKYHHHKVALNAVTANSERGKWTRSPKVRAKLSKALKESWANRALEKVKVKHRRHRRKSAVVREKISRAMIARWAAKKNLVPAVPVVAPLATT